MPTDTLPWMLALARFRIAGERTWSLGATMLLVNLAIGACSSRDGALAPSTQTPRPIDASSPPTKLLPARASNRAHKQRFRQVAALDGLFGKVVVVDDGAYRCLGFGYPPAMQTCVHRSNHLDYRYSYVHMMLAATAFVERPRRALILGLGGGAIAMLLDRIYPGIEIDAVEIDPAVVSAARGHLFYKPSRSTRIHVADAADFVRRDALDPTARSRYHLIFFDCYDDKAIPAQLQRSTFVRNLRRLLAGDGIVVVNLWGQHPSARTAKALYRRAFSDLWLIRGEGTTNQTLVAIAPGSATVKTRPILRRAGKIDSKASVPFALARELQRLERLKTERAINTTVRGK